MKCWLNGALLPFEEARIDPRDRGFLLGDGIFETLLAVDGQVRHARRHLARLFAGAQLIGIAPPFAKVELAAAMVRLLHDNYLQRGRAALRLTLTRGAGARGVAPPLDAAPSVLLTAVPLASAPAQMRAIISSHVRSEKSISSRIKSLNYLDNIMARREAVQQGADEAIMLNSAGNLAAASAANLFLVQRNRLYTPSIEDGALPGVMRAVVIEAAARLNIPVHEGPVAPAALAGAAEVFLTNALTGVCPLIEIGGKPVAAGDTGPVTEKLRLISKDYE